MPDLFIGTPWNTDMPTRGQEYRICPSSACAFEGIVDIMAYPDEELWTCPRCKTHVSQAPENGRYGRRTHVSSYSRSDPRQQVDDLHRTCHQGRGRMNLTRRRREEYGLE